MTVLDHISVLDIVQALVVVAALLLSARTSGRRPRILSGEGSAVGTFNPYTAIISLALICSVLRIGINLYMGAPSAVVPDETSILLQARMMALGAFALPAHPMAPWLEAIYVNHAPAYASMYSIGRGLPMGLALVVGLPDWAGLVAANFITALAMVWGARQYVSAKAAFAVGALYIVRFGTFGLFAASYLSPVLTILGATLVAGGYKAFAARRAKAAAALFGLGVFLLILTRPFEGALFCLPFAVAIAWRLFQRGDGRGPILRDFAIVLLFAASALALTAAHNRSTTGSTVTAPYNLYVTAWTRAPAFIFLPANESAQPRSLAIRRHLTQQDTSYAKQKTIAGFVKAQAYRAMLAWTFYIGIVLTLPFLIGVASLRREPSLCAATLLGALATTMVTWQHVQYLSAITFPLLVTCVLGLGKMLHMAGQWNGPVRSYARATIISIPLMLPAGLAILLVAPALAHLIPSAGGRVLLWQPAPDTHVRTDDRLRAMPGRDLVIVDNRPRETDLNIVYNEPLIDASEVVWACDDGRGNAALLRYYADRTIWALRWDQGKPRLALLRRPLRSPTSRIR